jgi:hypothetical protein
MKLRRARLGIVLALALAPAALASLAIAQPTREDRAAATALFDEGRRLAGDKRYAEACPKFEAAQRLDPGMGTLFNLSECYEKIGRTASAWAGYRDVASQARSAGQPDREKVARERVAGLESKLSKVRLVVPPELAGTPLTITRDGSPVPSALVGTPIPLDPGPHTIRIVAEGREPWETTLTVGTKGGTVDLPVPALTPKKTDGAPAVTTVPSATGAPAVTTAPSATGAPSAAVTAAPTSSVPAPAPQRTWQKPLGIVATVAGAAGLGVGVVFGVLAKGTFDESNKAHCSAATNLCDPDGQKMRLDALDQGNLGTGVFIAGAVLAAGGIVLWATAPSAPLAPAKSGSFKGVQVAASPGGLVVRGKF